MRCFVLLICTIICVFAWQPAQAQNAKELEKQLNAELRSAQGAFFNGKLDVADAGVKKSAELLESLKKLDPQHKQLKSFEQKLSKLQGDLAKKISKVPADGEKAGGKTPAPQVAAPAGTSSKALPRKTSQAMRELTRTLDSLERNDKDRMQQIQKDYSSYSYESTFSGIQQKIDSLPALLESVAKVAAEEGASEHPEFLATRERVATVSDWAGKELAKTRESVEQQKSGEAAAGEAASSLKKIWEDFDSKYFTSINNLSYENDVAKIGEAFALYSDYTGKKADLAKAVADFEAKYGTDRDAIEKATGGMEAVYPWQNSQEGNDGYRSCAGPHGRKG